MRKWAVEETVIGEGSEAVIYRVRTPLGVTARKRYKPTNRRQSFAIELALKDVSTRSPHLLHILGGSIQPTGERETLMEYCPGGSLRDWLNRQEALTPAESIVMAEQIARALASLHASGFIHNDVKPENIFLKSRMGTPHFKLGDYGQVTQTNSPADRRIGATPAYVAPERLEGIVDARSDVYSLAVTWYECRMGERIRRAEEVSELLPREERELLAACLSTEPANRPKAAELVARIQKLRPSVQARRYVDGTLLADLCQHLNEGKEAARV